MVNDRYDREFKDYHSIRIKDKIFNQTNLNEQIMRNKVFVLLISVLIPFVSLSQKKKRVTHY